MNTTIAERCKRDPIPGDIIQHPTENIVCTVTSFTIFNDNIIVTYGPVPGGGYCGFVCPLDTVLPIVSVTK